MAISITVRNNHPAKTICFPHGVLFHPNETIISDPFHIKSLRDNRKAFDDYCNTKLPGTRVNIFEIVAGSLDEPKVVKDESKGKGKGKGKAKTDPVNPSPFADVEEKDALGIIESMLDVKSLETIVSTEKRKSLVEAAKEKLELVRS